MGKDKKNSKTDGKKLWDWLNSPIVVAVLGTVGTFLVFVVATMTIVVPYQIKALNENVNTMNSRVTNLEKNAITKDILTKELEELEKSILKLEEDIDEDITEMKSLVYATMGLKLNENGENAFSATYEKNIDAYLLSNPLWKDVDIIAEDKLGNGYSAQELSGIKLVFPYMQNGNEVFFYGQFNENNHWDGNCIINIYYKDELRFIMDANYNDGELTHYKQAFLNGDVWFISDRERDNSLNRGDTWVCSFAKKYIKDFEFDSVIPDDILDIEEFKTSTQFKLEAFYHGNTSEGYYNDNTGEAYYVKYADDRTVQTLYKGMFEDGKFDDTTGNAWYITKNEETEYMYYQGKFKKGLPINNKGSKFENPIDAKRIEDIIGENTFECDLMWDFPQNI